MRSLQLALKHYDNISLFDTAHGLIDCKDIKKKNLYCHHDCNICMFAGCVKLFFFDLQTLNLVVFFRSSSLSDSVTGMFTARHDEYYHCFDAEVLLLSTLTQSSVIVGTSILDLHSVRTRWWKKLISVEMNEKFPPNSLEVILSFEEALWFSVLLASCSPSMNCLLKLGRLFSIVFCFSFSFFLF